MAASRQDVEDWAMAQSEPDDTSGEDWELWASDPANEGGWD